MAENLPVALTSDQAFLRLIVERLDQQAAILTDVHDELKKLNSNVIDVELAIEKAKAVTVNFDVDKLAERLQKPAVTAKQKK